MHDQQGASAVSITRAETASPVTRGRDDHLTGRHLAAVDDLDARRPDRPSTTPAYYLGRPASLWLDVFGRKGRRTTSTAGDRPSRERGDIRSSDEPRGSHRALPGNAA
jgi:hypothetical protein